MWEMILLMLSYKHFPYKNSKSKTKEEKSEEKSREKSDEGLKEYINSTLTFIEGKSNGHK